MVAKVSQLFECPRCHTPMSDEKIPEKCPRCKFKFLEKDEEIADQFSWGKPIPRQFFEMKQVLMEKYLDKPLNEIAPDLITKEKAEEMVVSNETRMKLIEKMLAAKRDKFFMETDADEVEDWFKSMWALMTMAIPSGNKASILKMATWGNEIGKLSIALNNYVKLIPELRNANTKGMKDEIKSFKKKMTEIQNDKPSVPTEGSPK